MNKRRGRNRKERNKRSIVGQTKDGSPGKTYGKTFVKKLMRVVKLKCL